MSQIETTTIQPRLNSLRQVLLASLVGTAIEFFDFYIYATAAVLVFPRLFFSASDPATSVLASLATFAIAFVARPVGSMIFGHFGDRIGRKKTLVMALMTMGLSTFMIGTLPSYHSIGVLAPVLLALCRFGQGIGLGGEWGGAVLLAVENAPPSKRAWYGMFPQLGAPVGFIFSGGIFLLLSRWLTNDQFIAFGWRVPFLASSILVLLGLYVRLNITETPAFEATAKLGKQANIPALAVLRQHRRQLVAGVLGSIATFVIFYLMTVFTLSWGTTALHYSRTTFLLMQLFGVLFFALAIPLSAWLAGHGRRPVMFAVTGLIAIFGLLLAPLLTGGLVGVLILMVVGFALTGVTFGPLGTVLSELFPTSVRYTGSSLAFSTAGILGASLTPSIAMWLATRHGLLSVGYYLAASSFITFAGLFLMRESKNTEILS